jgi:plastocyanin
VAQDGRLPRVISRPRPRTSIAAAAAILTCATLVPVVGAQAGATAGASAKHHKPATGKPQKRTVKIGDNYYSPAKLTVNYGSTVTWKWPSLGDTHDVALRKGPKGARKFQSEAYAADATFRQKFTRAGVYRIYCTFHQTEMRMTITVRHKPRSKRK